MRRDPAQGPPRSEDRPRHARRRGSVRPWGPRRWFRSRRLPFIPLLAVALSAGACEEGFTGGQMQRVSAGDTRPALEAGLPPGGVQDPEAVAQRLRDALPEGLDDDGTPPWARPLEDGLRPEPAAEVDAEARPAEPGRSRATAIVRAADRISPAVVAVNVIRTERVRPRTLWEEFFLPPGAARRVPGLGSGFVVDAGAGVVVTNEHVVRDADDVLITLPDGRDLDAEVVGADGRTDVAVLRADDAGGLPEAALGRSDDLLIGEWTVAVGNPFGNLISNPEPSVTTGVVSAVGRHIGSDRDGHGFYLGMIQTDAPINPGNSGGPLVNADGEVVGMNASIFTRGGGSEGLGFAIPVERVVRVGADLIEHGTVRRPWVGLEVEPMEADPFGRSRGVRVASVAGNAPAADAGLRRGDRLLQANGVRLVTPLDFEAILLDLRVGDPLELEVEGRPEPVVLESEPLPSLDAERVRVLEDLELATLTPRIRAEREVASEHGALVTGISPRLENQVGLRQGDVVLQVNNVLIETADQAKEVLESLRDGSWVRIYFERNRGVGVREFRLRR